MLAMQAQRQPDCTILLFLEGNIKFHLTKKKVEVKLDIKLIKEEMNKLIDLYRESNKISLNLIIFGIKEQNDEETLALVQEEVKNKSQFDWMRTH